MSERREAILFAVVFLAATAIAIAVFLVAVATAFAFSVSIAAAAVVRVDFVFGCFTHGNDFDCEI